jgi:hypothetical protein
MRALLDNSTITAALRAMGHIANPDRRLFEIDTAALRVLTDAVLLAEEILILDNYKEEHRAERQRVLSHSCFRFQEIPVRLDERFLGHARAHVHNWRLSQHLGTELADVLEDLAVMFRHAWRSSEAFLVLKAFGVDNVYHSSIVSALNDVMVQAEKAGAELTDFRPKSYNKKTQEFAQALSWLAIRTVYYRQAAKVTGCEYLPHPVRNFFNLKCILFDNHPFTRKSKLHSAALAPKNPSDPDERRTKLFEGLGRGEYFRDFGTSAGISGRTATRLIRTCLV